MTDYSNEKMKIAKHNFAVVLFIVMAYINWDLTV